MNLPALVAQSRSSSDYLPWLAAALLLAGCWLLQSDASSRRLIVGGVLTLVGGSILVWIGATIRPAVVLLWGVVLLASAMFVILRFHGPRRWWGLVVTGLAVLLMLGALQIPWHWQTGALWLLGAVIVLAAIATVSSRTPVYSAVWFALTLFGVGGWMLVQGAQFLAVATVAVYAGAIVVMLLFVLMLAQPEGQAFYDQVSWGRIPLLLSAATGALFIGLVVLGLMRGDWTSGVDPQWTAAVQSELEAQGGVEGDAPRALRALHIEPGAGESQLRVVVQAVRGRPLTQSKQQQWQQAIAARLAQQAPSFFGPTGSWRVVVTDADVLAGSHVSVLGRQLFGRHLVAVEVAGILLYLALVGAVAMSAVPIHRSPATPGAQT